MKLLEKVVLNSEIKKLVKQEKINHKKVVLCLGVFDLVHPGHIKHFQEAKKNGDILVVAVTANKYVNKGPDRPVFDQKLRMDSVAAIQCVDYVILNDHPDGIETILEVEPNYYVKGIEYKNHGNDITGKIQAEKEAVAKVGGKIVYTDDVVFSSSRLLNTYFREGSTQFENYIKGFKKNFSFNYIFEIIERLKNLKVLVVGDAIIDEYVYVQPMGVTGKGTHLVARNQSVERYLGGSLAVASHVASFTPHVTLLSAIGRSTLINPFKLLSNNICAEFLHLDQEQTLVKRRYVQQDGSFLTKLFETYSEGCNAIDEDETTKFEKYLKNNAKDFDLVLVCDFGNGFINTKMSQILSNVPTFLALNTQINSGNRGYHVVTKYNRADYISLNEPELRLTAHDLERDLNKLVEELSETMICPKMSITRGVNGVRVYDRNKGHQMIPALTQKVVDRVGAGDSYLALSALALANNESIEVAGFLGSAAAALDVQIVGNKKCIEKIPMLKYITTLLK